MARRPIRDFVVAGLGLLEAFASNPHYWVLQGSGGIVALQVMDSQYVLVVTGHAGNDFGALRYIMDELPPRSGQGF